jgi:RNA polymerase sigma-70 factor (ECF subfamily)
MTDEQLVRGAVGGDAAAFDQLVDRHAGACLRYATRMLGSLMDAEEVAQDTWLRAYRALGRYDPSTAFRTWLFAILINRCRTALASRTRRERLVRADAAAMRSAATSGNADAMVMQFELQRAVDRLTPDLREAFLLKHVEQLEYTEMAEVLGVGLSALKMRVQRACLQLRVELQEYHDER